MKKKYDTYFKNSLLGLTGILIYFLLNMYSYIPFDLLNIDLNQVPQIIKYLYTICIDLIILFSIYCLFKKTINENFIDLKKNHLKYFKKYIKYWFLALAIMVFSNLLIISITNNGISNNEQSIRNLLVENPAFTFIISVLIGPFIEELVFRLCIRKIIPIDWLFIVVSGIIFGSLHIISSYQVPTDLLFIIPYSAPGMIFAYTLVKSKNIFIPMGLHFIHNGLLMSLEIAALILL